MIRELSTVGVGAWALLKTSLQAELYPEKINVILSKN